MGQRHPVSKDAFGLDRGDRASSKDRPKYGSCHRHSVVGWGGAQQNVDCGLAGSLAGVLPEFLERQCQERRSSAHRWLVAHVFVTFRPGR